MESCDRLVVAELIRKARFRSGHFLHGVEEICDIVNNCQTVPGAHRWVRFLSYGVLFPLFILWFLVGQSLPHLLPHGDMEAVSSSCQRPVFRRGGHEENGNMTPEPFNKRHLCPGHCWAHCTCPLFNH